MSASDDELDDILDSALDAFKLEDSKPVATPAPPSAAQGAEKAGAGGSAAPAAAGDAGNEAQATDTAKAEAEVDEALRAFQEALSAPLPSDEAADEAADVRLVEDFVRGLQGMHSDAAHDEGHTPAAAESFVKSILEDMLSKEVLAEPIGQVRDALAASLQGGDFDDESRARHEGQLRIATALCDEFHGEARTERIVDLLAQLKDSGDLPPGVAADLPEPGDEAEQLAALGKSCPMQ